eukprot:5032955-Pyramimonas_sp.AAC.1
MYVPGTPEIRPVLLSAGVETVYSIRWVEKNRGHVRNFTNGPRDRVRMCFPAHFGAPLKRFLAP